ncbi:hypothetical protein JCM10213_007787 [Rhodosporidiobolus nylandii]
MPSNKSNSAKKATPAASSGSTSSSSRPTSPFALLIPELKAAVAQEVKLADDERRAEREARGRRKSRKAAKLSGLGSLALVSKGWWEVCRPMMWEHVNLRGRTTADLLFFIQTVLPRHAALVRCLSWNHNTTLNVDGVDPNEDEGLGDQKPLSKDEKRIVQTVEKLASVKRVNDAHFRRLRAIELLLAEAAKKCTKLVKVDFSNVLLFEHFLMNPSVSVKWVDYAQKALLMRPSTLQSLSLSFAFDFQEKEVTALIKACRYLKELSVEGSPLDINLDPQSASYRTFLRMIFDLPKLEFLSLAIPLPSDMRTIPLTAPLRHLQLKGDGRAFKSIEPFFARLSSTLTSLDLLPSADEFGIFDVRDSKQDYDGSTAVLPLPNLTHLTFAYSFPDALLPRFADSPLRIARFEDPWLENAGFSVASLLSSSGNQLPPPSLTFLASHLSTLKRVEVSLDEEASEYVSEPFEKWCTENGVQYRLEERPMTDDYALAAYGDCGEDWDEGDYNECEGWSDDE